MTRIGIISDTHNFLDETVLHHFADCQEIWHAGDFGTIAIAERLKDCKPLRGVFGNIDGQDIRSSFPEKQIWTCEEVRVYMTHIGGYPPKYNPATRKEIIANKPQLFICGHSHILKIIYDDQLGCLHINPGAAGNQGWHKIRTVVCLTIDGKEMRDCEVIELDRKT